MEKIKLGILGISGHFIKRVLIPLKNSSLIDIYAIASRSKEKAKETAEKYGIGTYYSSYEELLEDDYIKLVYIPLPNNMHAKWIKKAADAGKHIICEKPIAMNAIEAKEAIDYAKSKNVLITEAFMYKFHPQWQRVSELVDVGEIGKITLVNTVFSYSNIDPKNIRNIKTSGGGAIMDIGCYAVSVPRLIYKKEPIRVISLTNNDKNFDTDILSSAILDFGYERAVFTVATQSYPHQRVEIFGTGGIITINIPFNTFPDVPARVTIKTDVGIREFSTPPADHYGLEFEQFARSIMKEEPLINPPEDAINNMKVIDALFESSKNNSWINMK